MTAEDRETEQPSLSMSMFASIEDYLRAMLDAARSRADAAERDAAKYRALHTPEVVDFLAAVEREALFQRDKWGADGDAGKTDTDWFWLIGYLGGKAIRPDASDEKRLHHIITTAAAALNWHAARVGTYTTMRPGIAEPASPKLLADADAATEGVQHGEAK